MDDERRISGKKFLGLRKRLSLTQEELSREVKMSTANVRRVEASEVTTIRPQSFRRLAEIAKVSYVELQELLGVESSTDRPSVAFDLSPDEHLLLSAYAQGLGVPIPDAARALMLESLRAKQDAVRALGEVKSRGATTATAPAAPESSRLPSSRTEDAEDYASFLRRRRARETGTSRKGRKSA